MEQCVYWRTTQQQHDIWSGFLGSLWSACGTLDWRKQIYQEGKWSKFFGHTQQNTNAGVLMRVIAWSLAASECFRGNDHGRGQEQTVAESIMWPAQQSKMMKPEKDPQLRRQAHSKHLSHSYGFRTIHCVVDAGWFLMMKPDCVISYI